MGMEENAIIIDYLPEGYAEDKRPPHKREPVAIAVGDRFFSLIELIPKKDVKMSTGDRVYIGRGERDKIDYIKRRLTFNELTPAAKSELPNVVEKIVTENEKKFVEFFNTSQPLTTRLHQLELMPGIGDKLMWEIIEERKKKPFESFADITARIKAIIDPKKIIVKRVLVEIESEEQVAGKAKYRLFTSAPPQKQEKHEKEKHRKF